jgi:hypothetical protein
VLAISLAQVLLLRDFMPTAAGTDQNGMAIGTLSLTADRARGEFFFAICVWISIAAWVALWLLPLHESGLPAAVSTATGAPDKGTGPVVPVILKRLLLATTVTFCMFLPIVHGVTARDAKFHEAAVTTEGAAQPHCGLIVLTGASEVILWRASGGIGSAVSIPVAKIIKIVLGPEQNLYTAIQTAAKSKGSYPVCPVTQGGGM